MFGFVRSSLRWLRGPVWSKPEHAEEAEDWPQLFPNEETRVFLRVELEAWIGRLDEMLAQIEARVVQFFQVSVLLVTTSGILGGLSSTSALARVLTLVAMGVAVFSWHAAFEAFRPRPAEVGPNIADLTRDHRGSPLPELRSLTMEVMRDQGDDWNALRALRGDWYRRQIFAVTVLAILTALVAFAR